MNTATETLLNSVMPQYDPEGLLSSLQEARWCYQGYGLYQGAQTPAGALRDTRDAFAGWAKGLGYDEADRTELEALVTMAIVSSAESKLLEPVLLEVITWVVESSAL